MVSVQYNVSIGVAETTVEELDAARELIEAPEEATVMTNGPHYPGQPIVDETRPYLVTFSWVAEI